MSRECRSPATFLSVEKRERSLLVRKDGSGCCVHPFFAFEFPGEGVFLFVGGFVPRSAIPGERGTIAFPDDSNDIVTLS